MKDGVVLFLFHKGFVAEKHFESMRLAAFEDITIFLFHVDGTLLFNIPKNELQIACSEVSIVPIQLNDFIGQIRVDFELPDVLC